MSPQGIAVIPVTKEALHTEERSIQDHAGRVFEDFYEIGKSLEQIKANHLYKAETNGSGQPFRSWSEYCKSGRLEYRTAHADNLIKAAEYRPLLADIPTAVGNWGERTVRELTRLPEQRDAGRVSKKIVKHIEKTGDRLTAPLVKRFVDEDLGKPRKTDAKRAADLQEAAIHKTIEKEIDRVMKLRLSFEQIEGDWRKEAEQASPGIVKRFTTELGKLVSVLRS
jgi:hypothetical protein